jgi:Phage tail protein RIFT-related domain
VLTEVKAYSSWRSAPTLLLDDSGRAETDLIQIRNIDGLDPVKASVNTSPFGSVDGASFVGSSVLSRNIVLTLRPNPNWDDWTYESLRRLLYSYFMPKRPTRLVFYSDDMIPVEITGIVESVQVNQFSKDPELQVSIVCPDPYFTALDPTVITGQAVREDGATIPVIYNGTVESGIFVKVTQTTAPNPTWVGVQIGSPVLTYFYAMDSIDPNVYYELSSIPMQKYSQKINIGSGVITNILAKTYEGSMWPTLQPGENEFSVQTDAGVQDWELTYFERFGGL